MSLYAAGTEVPVDRSRSEIERILSRYGADSFAYGWQKDSAVVMFSANGRRIRFVLPLPNEIPQRRRQSVDDAIAAETRRRWRALVLSIKAKLETVASGISTFEDEFLPYTVLPDGRTVAEHVRPTVEEAYASGRLAGPILPGLPAPKGGTQ